MLDLLRFRKDSISSRSSLLYSEEISRKGVLFEKNSPSVIWKPLHIFSNVDNVGWLFFRNREFSEE